MEQDRQDNADAYSSMIVPGAEFNYDAGFSL